ncbi:hypothetical protein ND748_11320 [Frankia sp. AiPs1]|uniref:hypothetical protein n=1 Tax=Frankia sp. AiPs1 TaxID=573493 RepID=UPI0020433102|nr:hypothetical protein [Frankia sp. AiPs1]MCM3922244.1 hypothetical protein [Frankia sp. AiPs1]
MTTEGDRTEALRACLVPAYKRGLQHAADLALHAEVRPLLDLLVPPDGRASEHQRARTAHRMLFTAVDALTSPRANAAAIMLDLVSAPPGRDRGITARKEAAAQRHGISADWFTRSELGPMTLALAMELDQQLRRREGRTVTDPYRHRDPATLPPPPPASSYRPRPATTPPPAAPSTPRRNPPAERP